jgi:hypothetical protein
MKGVGIDDMLDHVAGHLPATDVGLHDFRHADRGSMLRVGPEVAPPGELRAPRREGVGEVVGGGDRRVDVLAGRPRVVGRWCSPCSA